MYFLFLNVFTVTKLQINMLKDKYFPFIYICFICRHFKSSILVQL